MNSLIERVKKYIAIHTDISQEKLAKQIGIELAALSGFLRGSYKGDQKAIADKLEALLAAGTKAAAGRSAKSDLLRL